MPFGEFWALVHWQAEIVCDFDAFRVVADDLCLARRGWQGSLVLPNDCDDFVPPRRAAATTRYSG